MTMAITHLGVQYYPRNFKAKAFRHFARPWSLARALVIIISIIPLLISKLTNYLSACSSPAAGHYPEPPPPPASTQETVTQNEFQIFGDPLCGNPLNESVPLPSMDDKNNCASSQCFPLTFDDNAPAAAIQLRQSQELSDFYCDVYPTMDCTESKTYYETQVAGIHKGDTIGCTPIPGPRLNMSVKCFCS